MAVPWLTIFDAVVGIANLARSRKAEQQASGERQMGIAARALGGVESRLTGVVVAALREAFDRDNRRLELEREQMEAERRRAERLLKLELLRQAADREVARLRLLAGVAVAMFVGTLFLGARVFGASVAAKAFFGLAWALLIGATAVALLAQNGVTAALERESAPDPGAGQIATFLILGSLVLVALALLVL